MSKSLLLGLSHHVLKHKLCLYLHPIAYSSALCTSCEHTSRLCKKVQPHLLPVFALKLSSREIFFCCGSVWAKADEASAVAISCPVHVWCSKENHHGNCRIGICLPCHLRALKGGVPGVGWQPGEHKPAVCPWPKGPIASSLVSEIAWSKSLRRSG